MAQDSLFEVMEAVIPALRADATLAALVGTKVNSHVPQGTAMPYVQVGDATTSLPFDGKDFEGDDMTLQIEGWSEAQSIGEIARIMAAIRNVLNKNHGLTLPSHTLILLRWEFGQIIKQPDGVTRQGVARYRVITTATSP